MKLIINGQDKTFDDTFSLKDIVINLSIEDKVMAAAVNMEIVKKDNWDSFIPKDNDKIEFLQFVGGG
jgi:sulfur carrier protein